MAATRAFADIADEFLYTCLADTNSVCSISEKPLTQKSALFAVCLTSLSKVFSCINKAFIDIRLRPSIVTPLATYRRTAQYSQT